MGFIVDNPARRWPLATVPFSVDGSTWANDTERTTARGNITSAIAEWESRTPLRFVSRTNELDYVEFIASAPPGACWSVTDTPIPGAAIGRMGGRQFIGCQALNPFTLIHEIGHAVGFYHEQQRGDRDAFVTIRLHDPWNTGIPSDGQMIGPYDCVSRMHYSNGNYVTINTGDACTSIGSATGLLSVGDVAAADMMYAGASLSVNRIYRDCMNQTDVASLRNLQISAALSGSTISCRQVLLRLENMHCG